MEPLDNREPDYRNPENMKSAFDSVMRVLEILEKSNDPLYRELKMKRLSRFPDHLFEI